MPGSRPKTTPARAVQRKHPAPRLPFLSEDRVGRGNAKEQNHKKEGKNSNAEGELSAYFCPTMNETNVIRSTSLILFGGEMRQMLWDLRWLIALSVALVAVDFWFGIKASLHRGEKIRKSRAGRRTMSKMVDYLCYLLLGGLIGQAIGEPLGISHEVVAASCMGLACLFEIDSILHNVCESRGVQVSVSLWRLLLGLVKAQNTRIGKALEKNIRPKKPT